MFHPLLGSYCSYCAAKSVTRTSERKHCDRVDAPQCMSCIILKLKGVYVRVSRIIRWMFKTMRNSSRTRTSLCNGFFGDWYKRYRRGK